MFKCDLQDIFQWVEHGQIYAVHQAHLAQGIHPHNSQCVMVHNTLEVSKRNDKETISFRGAPAIECRTGTRLVSPRHGPKKKILEASTTKVLNCHRTSYSLTVT